MKKVIIFLAVVFIGSTVYGGAGNSSGFALQEDLGARSVGLAGACSSLSGDVIFMHYNPASLAEMTDPQLSVLFYNSGLTGINYMSVTYGQEFEKMGILGISIAYLNGGQMDLNYIDGSTATVTSEQDIVANVSMGFNVSRELNAGLSLKGMYSSLVNAKSAITAAIDVGAIYKGFLMDEINFGISLQNLGIGLKYLDTTEPLPLNAQAGASFNFTIEEINFLAAVDGSYDINNKLIKVMIGLEGNYNEFFARFGVPISTVDDRMATAGIGYKFDEFMFDYGITFGKALDITHRISAEMSFGEGSNKTKVKKPATKVIK